MTERDGTYLDVWDKKREPAENSSFFFFCPVFFLLLFDLGKTTERREAGGDEGV